MKRGNFKKLNLTKEKQTNKANKGISRHGQMFLGPGREGQNQLPQVETLKLIFKNTAAPCHDKGLLFTPEASQMLPYAYTIETPDSFGSWLADPQTRSLLDHSTSPAGQ